MKTLLFAGLVLTCVTARALAASDHELVGALKQQYLEKPWFCVNTRWDSAGTPERKPIHLE